MNVTAYQAGFRARHREGLPVTNNPYAKHTAAYRWWNLGWCDADEFFGNIHKVT